MVAISIFLEAGAVITGIAVGVGGKEYGAIGRAIGYALSAIGVCIGTSLFLSERNVLLHDVTVWGGTQEERARPWWRGDPVEKRKYLLGLLGAVACAIMLGAVAYGYEAILKLIPSVAELINKSRQEMASVPFLKASYFVMAVGFAPFAEEYLFRGLVYRALDREWGGWRAVVGSAAFFVIYHHPLAWLPVGLLGVANAIIFKKTGRLAPAVVLHMVYNAVVLSS
jgi:membrane protease YdiL (CAAX protease family)